jgi:hypothetical protein
MEPHSHQLWFHGHCRPSQCSSLLHVRGRQELDTSGWQQNTPPQRCQTPGSGAHQQSQKRAATARAPAGMPRWWPETAAAPTPGPAYDCIYYAILAFALKDSFSTRQHPLCSTLVLKTSWCLAALQWQLGLRGWKHTLPSTGAWGDDAGLAAAAPLLPAASPACAAGAATCVAASAAATGLAAAAAASGWCSALGLGPRIQSRYSTRNLRPPSATLPCSTCSHRAS